MHKALYSVPSKSFATERKPIKLSTNDEIYDVEKENILNFRAGVGQAKPFSPRALRQPEIL